MQRKTFWILIVGSLGVILLPILVLLHAFRVEHEDHMLGLMQYQYRWWKPHELRLDNDRDGVVDARATVRPGNDFFDTPEEYWEDRNSDGRFEIHVIYSGDRVGTVELDENFDGIYDRKFTGDDAEHFFERYSEER